MISPTNPLYAKADQLAKNIYGITQDFPKHEMYGMTSQIRRAALSVILNIIEGFARQSPNEYRRFLLIAFGSLQETKYLLYFSKEQNYIDENSYTNAINLAEEIAKILWSIVNKDRMSTTN